MDPQTENGYFPGNFVTVLIKFKRNLYAAPSETKFHSVGIAVRDRVSVGAGFLSSLRRLERFWGPNSLLLSGYWAGP
jgi:hypothetical protein